MFTRIDWWHYYGQSQLLVCNDIRYASQILGTPAAHCVTSPSNADAQLPPLCSLSSKFLSLQTPGSDSQCSCNFIVELFIERGQTSRTLQQSIRPSEHQCGMNSIKQLSPHRLLSPLPMMRITVSPHLR